MKSLLVLTVVVGYASVYAHLQLSEEQMKKVHEEIEQCAVESKVDRQLLDDIKNGKNFTVTRELDCFSACVLKKNGVMKPDGTIDQDKPNKSEAQKECKQLTGKDECETGGKVMACFAKNHLIPKFSH